MKTKTSTDANHFLCSSCTPVCTQMMTSVSTVKQNPSYYDCRKNDHRSITNTWPDVRRPLTFPELRIGQHHSLDDRLVSGRDRLHGQLAEQLTQTICSRKHIRLGYFHNIYVLLWKRRSTKTLQMLPWPTKWVQLRWTWFWSEISWKYWFSFFYTDFHLSTLIFIYLHKNKLQFVV